MEPKQCYHHSPVFSLIPPGAIGIKDKYATTVKCNNCYCVHIAPNGPETETDVNYIKSLHWVFSTDMDHYFLFSGRL